MIKRYEWEDALIQAQADGVISNGALLACLKLAKAINWNPQGARRGMESALYWKNDDAFAAVGLGRSTFYKHNGSLFEQRFLTLVNGNLVPTLPSTVETEESAVETQESTGGTEKSTGDNPYSEDTYTEDEYSEDSYADSEPALAVARTATQLESELLLDNSRNIVPPPAGMVTTSSNQCVRKDAPESPPESTVETLEQRKKRENRERVQAYQQRIKQMKELQDARS